MACAPPPARSRQSPLWRALKKPGPCSPSRSNRSTTSASRCWSTTSPTCSRWTRGRPGARSAATTRGSSPLFEDGWLYEGLVAEHGFSVLVTVERGGAQQRILFDAGLSPDALVTNMRRMGLDPSDVEIIVLSHGHSDHTTGLDGFIRAVGRRSLPVLIHPDF